MNNIVKKIAVVALSYTSIVAFASTSSQSNHHNYYGILHKITAVHNNGTPFPEKIKQCKRDLGSVLGTQVYVNYFVNELSQYGFFKSGLVRSNAWVALHPMGIKGRTDFISDQLPSAYKEPYVVNGHSYTMYTIIFNAPNDVTVSLDTKNVHCVLDS